MEKEFNVTGTCIPDKHYVVDVSGKLEALMKIIEKGKYFIINRPRQYGKTTTLYMLEKTLEKNEEYLVVSISFEGVGDLIFEEEQSFTKEFVQILADSLFMLNEELAEFLEEEKNKVNNLSDLSRAVTKFIKKSNKKVVLMIDEADKSSNNQLFLSFLGMLRNKYLNRNAGKDYTFHSVILAGVHDVRSLKSKIRSEVEHKYNSPWNIATDFDLDMSFSKEEIGTMLKDYENSTSISVDKEYYSERLRYYTSGYPFLVSKLCKIIDEKLLTSGEGTWENEYMDIAVKEILKASNTNFGSLIKNLENNKELKELVKKCMNQDNGQPNPIQYPQPEQSQQPQYSQTPQYQQVPLYPQPPQIPQNPQYYQGGNQGYPPQQNYYPHNQYYYQPIKKKSKIKKVILLLLLLSALSAAALYYAGPIQQFATRYYWQNQWRFVEGKAENEKEINKMLKGFAAALVKKDANAAAVFVYPDKAEAYKKMFAAKPEGMTTLASSLSAVKGIQMTQEMTRDKESGRIAEVKIIYNNTQFEIQLKKVNDKWYVFNI